MVLLDQHSHFNEVFCVRGKDEGITEIQEIQS